MPLVRAKNITSRSIEWEIEGLIPNHDYHIELHYEMDRIHVGILEKTVRTTDEITFTSIVTDNLNPGYRYNVYVSIRSHDFTVIENTTGTGTTLSDPNAVAGPTPYVEAMDNTFLTVKGVTIFWGIAKNASYYRVFVSKTDGTILHDYGIIYYMYEFLYQNVATSTMMFGETYTITVQSYNNQKQLGGSTTFDYVFLRAFQFPPGPVRFVVAKFASMVSGGHGFIGIEESPTIAETYRAELYKIDGSLVLSRIITGKTEDYLFKDQPPGGYYVEVTPRTPMGEGETVRSNIVYVSNKLPVAEYMDSSGEYSLRLYWYVHHFDHLVGNIFFVGTRDGGPETLKESARSSSSGNRSNSWYRDADGLDLVVGGYYWVGVKVLGAYGTESNLLTHRIRYMGDSYAYCDNVPMRGFLRV